ncbi:MAG: hypothetical protein JOZ51_17605 [Chloroflexi bacterium]|nr:hypothetical protein [Chloroflexota bacterium]
MASSRKHRSHWYGIGRMLRSILLPLALTLFVTSCGSPPIQSTIYLDRFPHIPSTSRLSTVIVIGTVKQILPVRWTTPSGKRPGNPTGHAIFRPVMLDVEEYLKGEQNARTLQLYAWGGRIGDDVFEAQPDTLYEFQQGEHVVVFLEEFAPGSSPLNVDGSSLWSIQEHYTLTDDGQAQNFYQTLPLAELRATIQTALQP